MSLHAAAQHLATKGRGKDTTLVHMSPRELQGLQALAKASGGSLTVNPKTGLAEAGFLEQVLPIVAMAAATYFTAGAAAPALSAALGSTMAGGLAAGTLAGAGVGAIGAGVQGKDVGQGALMGGLGGAISGGMGAYSGGAETAAVSGANEAAQTANAVNVANTGASGQQMLDKTIAAQMADPNAGLAGTSGAMPSPAATGGPGFTADEMAMGSGRPELSGQVNSYDPYAKIPGEPTIGGAKAPPTYYSEMGLPGKAMTLAAPGIGADIGMNTPKPYDPTAVEPAGSAMTLSPNFQGYTPPAPDPYKAKYTRYAAQGGLMALAAGGPVEQMSQNVMGGQGNMFPLSQQEHTNFATPTQMPASAEVVRSDYDVKTNPYTGIMMAEGGDVKKKKRQAADLTPESRIASYDPYNAGIAMVNNARNQASLTGMEVPPAAMKTLGGVPVAASGGLADVGGYSDGGRLLKGPGDGMSDHIPAQIGDKQPARLADGEFVVPADVVSHLGNGSTDAGAKRLYAMMDKVRHARTGKKKQAPAVNFKNGVPV